MYIFIVCYIVLFHYCNFYEKYIFSNLKKFTFISVFFFKKVFKKVLRNSKNFNKSLFKI